MCTEDKKERRRRIDAEYRERVRQECFAHYGGAFCCRCSNTETLELHHKDGEGGNKDSAERIGRGLRSSGGWHFYVKLRQAGFPEGFEVICTPCHDEEHGRKKKGGLP